MNSRSPQILLFIFLISGGAILLLQNSEPLNLVILNQPLPLKLPLSFWVIFAVILGMVTNLIIQLLLGLGNQQGGDRIKERVDSFKKRPPRAPDNRTGRSDWERNRANYDWTDKEAEEKDAEAWDIESPPQQTTRPKAPRDRPQEADSKGPKIRSNQTKPRRPRPEPESPQETGRPPRRKKSQPPNRSQPEHKKGKGVYDADYRVITPPYESEEEQPRVNIEDDEEWI